MGLRSAFSHRRLEKKRRISSTVYCVARKRALDVACGSTFHLWLSAGYFGGGIVDAKVDESPIRFWVAAMFHLSLGVTLIIVGLHGPS